ncbi:hypothetical protein LY78DRAFT_495608 [Colletotrichum sublineola]|nr:hypothetical protein LY78DRAFT_495608 [Colletotrichum sublineola]
MWASPPPDRRSSSIHHPLPPLSHSGRLLRVVPDACLLTATPRGIAQDRPFHPIPLLSIALYPSYHTYLPNEERIWDLIAPWLPVWWAQRGHIHSNRRRPVMGLHDQRFRMAYGASHVSGVRTPSWGTLASLRSTSPSQARLHLCATNTLVHVAEATGSTQPGICCPPLAMLPARL